MRLRLHLSEWSRARQLTLSNPRLSNSDLRNSGTLIIRYLPPPGIQVQTVERETNGDGSYHLCCAECMQSIRNVDTTKRLGQVVATFFWLTESFRSQD